MIFWTIFQIREGANGVILILSSKVEIIDMKGVDWVVSIFSSSQWKIHLLVEVCLLGSNPVSLISSDSRKMSYYAADSPNLTLSHQAT